MQSVIKNGRTDGCKVKLNILVKYMIMGLMSKKF